MTPQKYKPLNVVGMFQAPGTRNYIIVGFAALLVYYLLMSARGSDAGALIALLVAVPGFLARWMISPVAVVLLTTYLVIDPNFAGLSEVLDSGNFSRRSGFRRTFGPRDASASIQLEDMLLAAALLVYLMAQYRMQSLVLRSLPEQPEPYRRGDEFPVPPTRPVELVTDRELRTMFIVGASSAFIGLIGWWLLLVSERGLSVSRSLLMDLPWGRFLMFAWAVGTGLLIARAVLSYLANRRMRPEEARLILHDTFWIETRRESERILRWRNWYQRQLEAKT